jgi:tRNA(Glu) U13 pseudouridine synthase TruD
MLSIEVEQKNWQTGANFRKVKNRPVVMNVPVYLLDKVNDKLHRNGKQAITITFCLPTGCYATMLVKQLLLSSVRDKTETYF